MSGDDRFNSMHKSATFKSSKKDNFKVKVDDRFKTLLSDERFQSVPGQVDRYGRKTKGKDGANKVAKEMREFYDIDEGEEEAPTEPSSKKTKGAAKPANTGLDRLDYLNKLARGEISDDDNSDSDSSDESDDSDSNSDESGSDEDSAVARNKKGSTYGDSSYKGALQVPGQEEAELVDDVVSSRIAIQNSDWENVSAEDLM